MAERTDGRIALTDHHSVQRGEGEFAAEQLRFGALDHGVLSPAPMVGTVKERGIVLASGPIAAFMAERPWFAFRAKPDDPPPSRPPRTAAPAAVRR